MCPSRATGWQWGRRLSGAGALSVPLGLLPKPYERLVWGTVAITLAVARGGLLRSGAHRLQQRKPGEERELQRLRGRETAIVLLATAIPYATAIIVVIDVASLFLPRGAAALGGSAFVGVPRRLRCTALLMDVIAGGLIAFERWYAVGDFVMLEPAKASGYRRYTTEILTSDPEEARRAIESAGRRAPVGEARLLARRCLVRWSVRRLGPARRS